jgi:DNA-binding MarR family transcriptional regulator
VTDLRGPQDAWSTFVRAVFDVDALINKAGERVARPLGQSAARWHVLGRAFQPQTVAQMAADMGHAPQSVQRLVNVLEAEGLLTLRPHPSDRRTKLVELTPSGHEVLTGIYEQQVRWFQGLAPRLSETALNRLACGLADVAEALHASLDDTDTDTARRRETDTRRRP